MGTLPAAMAANQLALMKPSLFALMEQHPLSFWREEEEDWARVVALLEDVVDVVVVVVVVDVVVLDARLVTPLRKTLMKILTRTTTRATEGTMTMTMTLTMTLTMTMTMTMTTDSDVLVVHPAVALMGLDHLARTTRDQTRVLTAPHQPGFHLARLEDGQDVPTTKGPSALMAPDPTTGSAKTQTDPPAPMELLLSALTAALLPQSQFVQTPLMSSFSELKGETCPPSRPSWV